VNVADAQFEEPRLAEIYDPLDPDRSDLEVYVAIVEEFAARTMLDIGCGTGTFACLLAQRGIDVTAVDPAEASLEVARAKAGAEKVRWVHGDSSQLPTLHVDLATMTGNVAQVFVTDEAWRSTLAHVRAALRPGGRFVFETRDPARRAWNDWNRESSYARTAIAGVGDVETWVQVTDVRDGLVSFESVFVFTADGTVMRSHSTLRFRDRDEIVESLRAGGYSVQDIRDARDRPGREFVFVAQR
jgi:SAM-dependent methyltransferase